MRKKYLLMAVAAVLVFGAVLGGSLAALNTTTNQAAVTEISTNQFQVGLESATETVSEEVLETSAHPGDVVDVSYNIANTGSNEDYSMYVRATIYKQWSDASLDGEEIHLFDNEAKDAETYDADLEASGWIVGYEDSEEIVLYYSKELTPGDATSNLFEGVLFSERLGNEYTDCSVTLSIEIDAVQSTGAVAAMRAEWGVSPTMADDGTITAISDTWD